MSVVHTHLSKWALESNWKVKGRDLVLEKGSQPWMLRRPLIVTVTWSMGYGVYTEYGVWGIELGSMGYEVYSMVYEITSCSGLPLAISALV